MSGVRKLEALVTCLDDDGFLVEISDPGTKREVIWTLNRSESYFSTLGTEVVGAISSIEQVYELLKWLSSNRSLIVQVRER